MNFDKTTIIALSTPYQISAIHVLRLSGSKSLSFLKKVCSFKEEVKARRVYFRRLIDPIKGIFVDEVICFYFDAPHSYTGEEMVEIHTHGSVLIVDMILEIAKKSGVALAKPGEFTERAFLNGKINIDQAQAVDGLIRAKQSYLRDNALKILSKKEAFGFEKMREDFIQVKAKIEAMIEFPEDDAREQQVNNTYESLSEAIEKMSESLRSLSHNYQSAKKREEGIHVVILGEPNVGKSTLLNFLLSKKRSIVSPESGTTRDYIKELYATSLGNFWLYDTAGIREAKSEIEKEGIGLSLDLSREADFLLVLFDDRLETKWFEDIDFPRERMFIYLNKAELLDEKKIEFFKKKFETYGVFHSFSLNGADDSLRNEINNDFFNLVKQFFSLEESQLSLINDRQFNLVLEILLKLEDIKTYLKNQVEAAILAGELQEVNLLFGDLSLREVEGEEVFDHLFRSFCIGK